MHKALELSPRTCCKPNRKRICWIFQASVTKAGRGPGLPPSWVSQLPIRAAFSVKRLWNDGSFRTPCYALALLYATTDILPIPSRCFFSKFDFLTTSIRITQPTCTDPRLHPGPSCDIFVRGSGMGVSKKPPTHCSLRDPLPSGDGYGESGDRSAGKNGVIWVFPWSM